MKANSRRRVLISSLAMLMVALVALSTATFAWFTTNNQSYADGINATTTKQSTLVLSKSDKKWKTHVEYGFGTSTAKEIMMPASSIDGTTWWYGDAIDGEGDIKVDTLKATVATDTDYVFAEELNIKNDGQAKVTGITISFPNLANASDYARVALVPVEDANDDKVVTEAKAFTASVYDNGQKEAYNPIDNKAVSATTITCDGSCTVSVGDLEAGEMAYYKLYVWFEGQDAECINANSGQEAPNLKFDVTGTVVQ